MSDWVGGVGGILIAIPAIKDQCYRFKRYAEVRNEKKSPWPGLRKIAQAAWERRRNDYDGLDSFMTMIGALGIAASFIFKIFNT